jgi:predicted transcriptional regulator of viral defense system
MNFVSLLEIVGDEPVFETGLLLAGDANTREIHRQLSRWRQSGKIYQLRRGLYCLAPPFRKKFPHPFLVANRLLPASYVSRQSALAYYGMLPEHVPVTTCVTTDRPGHWETPLGIFDYRHIQVDFFAGYRSIAVGEKQQAFIAAPEKALLDLIYLEPGGDTPDYLAELRLSNLNRLDWPLLERLAGIVAKPKLARAVAAIRELAGAEEEYETL